MKRNQYRLVVAFGLSLALMTLLLVLVIPHEALAQPGDSVAARPGTGDPFAIAAVPASDQSCHCEPASADAAQRGGNAGGDPACHCEPASAGVAISCGRADPIFGTGVYSEEGI